MNAVDTSWLFAFISNTDEHHAEARRQATEPSPILVNAVVLVETLDLVRSRSDRQNSLRILKALTEMPHVRFVPAPREPSLRRVMEHGGISWHDATAICTALEEGAGLRTFDGGQRKAFASLT